jgi:hypothetical protein
MSYSASSSSGSEGSGRRQDSRARFVNKDEAGPEEKHSEAFRSIQKHSEAFRNEQEGCGEGNYLLFAKIARQAWQKWAQGRFNQSMGHALSVA